MKESVDAGLSLRGPGKDIAVAKKFALTESNVTI
jgi:hypothetical protein